MKDNEDAEVSIRIIIPQERVPVLIGKGGSVRKEIEEKFKVKISIDSTTGNIVVKANQENADALLKVQQVIKAIGRGFSPENAFLLANDEYTLSIINLSEFGRTENSLRRIRGRIIGRKGKSRLLLEELTNTKIVVYGKTVGIIGPMDKVGLAEEAIRKLAEGMKHSTVFDWLYEQKRLEKMMSLDRALRKPYEEGL